MFPSSTLLSLLLVAASAVHATPIKRDLNNLQILSFTSKINTIGGKTLAELDRARASALRANALGNANRKHAADSVFVNNTGVTYTASVGVGSPATQCESGNRSS